MRSFYNLFDVDADVGLRVGLNLSGARTPNMWKVGCHKDVFPHWAAKVRREKLLEGRPTGRTRLIRVCGQYQRHLQSWSTCWHVWP